MLVGQLLEHSFVEEHNSTDVSIEKSSGYESLNAINDMKEYWQISSNESYSKTNDSKLFTLSCKDQFNSSATAGPFLTTLMEKLKNFLSNSFYINLHLTGLISRLAAYPQPLLRAYLLDYSLVLQPNVPSLFEVNYIFIILILQRLIIFICMLFVILDYRIIKT